jgi:polysaccharide deacetylase family protein (PEP-CTERM system associated)
MQNILTFDVEDWYHGLDMAPSSWADLEKRLPVGLEFILERLAQHQRSATFFVLGVTAHEHPDTIRRIAADGHEIGTHGWNHTPIYRQKQEQFRAELIRSLEVLDGLSGSPAAGHRAAMFSITARSLWALEILATAGLCYDSSIFPVHNYRYGVPAAQRFPYRLQGTTPPADGLWELPISTLRVACVNLPIGGGFYARFWPYGVLRLAIQTLNAQGQPAIIYFHPWEFDPEQPWLRTGPAWLARFTHYYRLASTRETLCRLLNDFQWTSAAQFIRTRPTACAPGAPP